jgi:hypothetical protein
MVQTTFAMAPLCSQALLHPPSQKEQDQAIEAFTRMTMQADLAQAMGQTDASYKSLRLSQKSKEQELLRALNISLKEFRELVNAKNISLQKNKEIEKREESQSRKVIQENLFNPFDLVKSHRVSVSGAFLHQLAPNGKSLTAIRGNYAEIISMDSGKSKQFIGSYIYPLKDSLFEDQGKITKLNSGRTSQIQNLINASTRTVSADQKSLLRMKNDWTTSTLTYELVESSGKRLYADSIQTPFSDQHVAAKYVGKKYWILIADETLYLFNPQSKKILPLNVEKSPVYDVYPVSDTQVILTNTFKMQILDLDTLQVSERDFTTPISVAFANKEFVWVKEATGMNAKPEFLRKISLTDIDKDIEVREITKSFSMAPIPGTNFVFIIDQAPDYVPQKSSFQSGVYKLDNLAVPVFSFTSHYVDLKGALEHVWISDDGQRIVISGTAYSGQPTPFLDVWDRPKN